MLGRLVIRRLFSTRNIGIIAHIDAGKTTTTERMLYYSGLTSYIGDVDNGNTVTDFLPQERERGITIQSAAISFDWRDTHINLIDTPGHADFTFEVVRSLRVLDGAVTVLDGVAGVEAQTEKVWSQAAAMGIPRIVFVNKMDRSGAGFGRTVREVVSKLHTGVALLNIPYFEQDEFKGVIDVLHQKVLVWDPESKGREVKISEADTIPDAQKAREALVESLADVSEEVLDVFVGEADGDAAKVPSDLIKQALRKATINNEITPVLCGASFRNIGVQPLLDGIVDYLPSPEERPNAVPEGIHATCALAFKVVNDPIRGILVYVRVYSGTLKQGSTIYNTTTGTKERASKLLQMQADSPVDIKEIPAGGIGVISGTTNIRTGDTLIAHATKKDGISALSAKEKKTELLPITVPHPVFVSRITPKGAGSKRGMEKALEILLKEDPSLHVSYDDENGQWLLSGMGELHLEIARDRLVNELKANVEAGSIMITLKETIKNRTPWQEESSLSDGAIHVKVQAEPLQDIQIASMRKDPRARELADENFVIIKARKHPFIGKEDIEKAAIVGILPVLAKGGQIGHAALRRLRIIVEASLSPETQEASSLSGVVRGAMQQCLGQLNESEFSLLEPSMSVIVNAPQDDIGKVMTDITNVRRGHIQGMGDVEEDASDVRFKELADNVFTPVDHTMYMSKHEEVRARQATVKAIVPLRTMIGYLNSLRSMTQGRGTFQMHFEAYEPVPLQDVEQVLTM